MAFNLRNRNFLKLLDFTPAEIKYLLKLSADLKAAKYAGTEVKVDGIDYIILRAEDILGIVE